jgi:YVTN family beta-propeller protein
LNFPLLPFLVVLFTFAILSGGCALTRERSGARTPAAKGKPILFVLNKSDASVSAMDPYGGEELYRLAVGDGPHEAAPSPDGSTVVVCNYGERSPGSSLSIIDVSKREVVATIDLEFHRPHGILFLDDTRFVVTAEAEKKLLLIDLETRTVLRAIDTEQEISHMVSLSQDHRRAFVANIRSGSVSVIDLEAGRLEKVIETGAGAEGIATRPAGTGDVRQVWVTNRSADTVSILDSETLELVGEIPCASFPIRIQFTPDGDRALVSCARSGELVVFDVNRRVEIERIAMNEPSIDPTEREKRLFGNTLGEGPVPVGILVEPGGERAYVANTNADIVTVIDLETYGVVRRLVAGKEPDGLAWVVTGVQ